MCLQSGAGIALGPLGNQSRRFPPSKKNDGAPLRGGGLKGDSGTAAKSQK